jgi:hypothetical protein
MRRGYCKIFFSIQPPAWDVEHAVGGRYIKGMAVYFARDFPFCGNYFGVVIAKLTVAAIGRSTGVAATADIKCEQEQREL